MTETPNKKPAMSNKTVRALIAVACLAAIAMSTGAIILQMDPDRNMRLDLARLKKLGYPTTPDELQRVAKSGDQNAAPVLKKTLAAWTKTKTMDRNKALWYAQDLAARDITAADKKLVSQHIGGFSPVLALAEEAAQMPVCNWDRDWTNGPGIYFNETSGLKQIVNMVLMRARMAAINGDTKAAIKDFRTADRLAGFAGDDPALTPFIGSLALKTMCDAAVRRMLNDTNWDKESLVALRDAVDEGAAIPDLRHGLASELVFARIALGNIEHLSSYITFLLDEGKEQDFTSPKLRKEAEQKVIRAWRTTMDQLPENAMDWKESTKAFHAGTGVLTRDESLSGKLAQHLWVHHGITVERWMRAHAQRRLAQTAVRLKLQQLEGGSLPETLTAVEESGKDPFDGQALRYKKTDDGFMLYSIGTDGDQGGASRGELYSKGASDIVWIVRA